MRLIARHGYAAVSMRQIAADVGVQAGALYLYTPDKQTLLFDLMRSHLQDLLAAWVKVDLPGDPVDALTVFTRFHLRFHMDRPEAVFIAYMELRNLSPENFELIERMRADYESRLEAILKAGAERGDFTIPDARLATMAVIAMLTGVTTWFRKDGRLDRDQIEGIYCDMVRRSVGGRDPSGSPQTDLAGI